MNNDINERKKTVLTSIGGEEEKQPVALLTRCLRCGYPIRPGIMVCPHCGYDVETLIRQSTEQNVAQSQDSSRSHKATRMVAVSDIPAVTLKPVTDESRQPQARLEDGNVVEIGGQLFEIHFDKK